MLLLSHNFACYYHIKGFNIMHKFIISNIEEEHTIKKDFHVIGFFFINMFIVNNVFYDICLTCYVKHENKG